MVESRNLAARPPAAESGSRVFDLELSLPVVGIGYLNQDRTNRSAELLKCEPGEAAELRPEPTCEHDPHAIAVFSARGIQIGYLEKGRAPYIGQLMATAPFAAIFQNLDVSVAYVCVRFGGGAPALPVHQGGEHMTSAGADGFYPDPDGPIWGA